jgi:quercetin dioxygenase-like cupin family protein
MTTRGILGSFELHEEMARFAPNVPSGRRSETLIKSPMLRVVLVTMREGTELHEHSAPGPITVQPITGRFVLTVEGTEHELAAGTLVAVEGGARHTVRALTDGAFLLTIAWHGDEREETA